MVIWSFGYWLLAYSPCGKLNSSKLAASTKAALSDHVWVKFLYFNAKISEDSLQKSKFEILIIFQINLATERLLLPFNSQHFLSFPWLPHHIHTHTLTHFSVNLIYGKNFNYWEDSVPSFENEWFILDSNLWCAIYGGVVGYSWIIKSKGLLQESRNRKWEEKLAHTRVAWTGILFK